MRHKLESNEFFIAAAVAAAGGSVSMLAQSAYIGGLTAVLFSLVLAIPTFAFVFIGALFFGAPVYWLHKRFPIKPLFWFPVYSVLGLAGGALAQLVLFGNIPFDPSHYDPTLSGSYALIGLGGAIAAWVFMSRASH